MEREFIEAAEGYEGLGPQYFAAKKIAEQFMAAFEAEHFKPLIDKFVEQFRDVLWTNVEDCLLSDTESNIHNTIWRRIDASVNALLSGEEWALRHYSLGSRYDHDKVRAAIAKHIPAELQNKRVADLEAELNRVRKDLAQRRY